MKHRWGQRYCWMRKETRKPRPMVRFTAEFIEKRMQQHVASLLAIEALQFGDGSLPEEPIGAALEGNSEWKALGAARR